MTAQEVMVWLQSKNTNGVALSSAQQVQLTNEINAKTSALSVGGADGGITLLYSGKLGVGDSALYTWQVAEEISKASNGKVVAIGQTELGKLFNSDLFKEHLRSAVGGNNEMASNILNGYTDSSGQKVQGVWDVASQRLANAASGDVRTLTPFAEPAKVFIDTELPALLKNPAVKSINGVDKAVFEYIYQKTGSLLEVNKAVAASSSSLIQNMALVKTGETITKVDSTSLFQGTSYPGTSVAANEVNVSIKTAISQSLTAQAATTLGEGWKNLSMGAKGVVALQGGAKLLGGLGVAATAYEIAHMADAGQTTYAAGRTGEFVRLRWYAANNPFFYFAA